MLEIGDVEIPIVGTIEVGATAEYEEIQPINNDHIGLKHEHEPLEIAVAGFINEHVHSDELSLLEQRQIIRSLRSSDITDNDIEILGNKGHLLVDNVDFTDNLDSKIVDAVEIEGRFLPWPKFYSDISLTNGDE